MIKRNKGVVCFGDLSRKKRVYIYDSTLRDGAQAEGISFTVEDKLRITKRLDDFGVDYIEAGNPGSNPKDLEFFRRIKELGLKHAKLTAFGSTRRARIPVQEDRNVLFLLNADTPAVAIFGKSWDFHVTDIIRTSLEENLAMIRETLAFFKEKGKEVIFDAEHFFDGYKSDPAYAMATLRAAVEAGADWVVLCDTNGGSLPTEIAEITQRVVEEIPARIGIHCHNDGGMAVANSIMAVMKGASQIQGTFNGYGERCGNANLCTIIPNLSLKMGYQCLSASLRELTGVSRYISELANMAHNERAPYVGNSAFAHKGGMHIDGVVKNSQSFEHIDPELVGNKRRFLMSEVSGRSTILSRIQEVEPNITKDSEETQLLIDKLKQLEHEGYQFEGAESSFELLIRRSLGKYKTFFTVKDFKVISEQPWKDLNSASAMIKVQVDGVEEITAAEGDGPVNALDKALRKALGFFYPQLNRIRLTDYKVRVLNSNGGTAAKVRVHIESTDGKKIWGTVGVSTNIIEASWKALVDSIEYALIHQEEEKTPGAV
jgi:2-isopropylmalate synthase